MVFPLDWRGRIYSLSRELPELKGLLEVSASISFTFISCFTHHRGKEDSQRKRGGVSLHHPGQEEETTRTAGKEGGNGFGGEWPVEEEGVGPKWRVRV